MVLKHCVVCTGGRIDHAHHSSNAFNSLHEYVAFDESIQKGLDMTSTSDTLITVTADHSHVFTLGSYSERGNPIFCNLLIYFYYF